MARTADKSDTQILAAAKKIMLSQGIAAEEVTGYKIRHAFGNQGAAATYDGALDRLRKAGLLMDSAEEDALTQSLVDQCKTIAGTLRQLAEAPFEASLQSLQSQLNQEKEHYRSEQHRLQEHSAALEAELHTLKTKHAQSIADISDLKNDLSEKEKQISQKEEQVRRLDAEHTQLAQQLEEQSNHNAQLNSELSLLRCQHQTLEEKSEAQESLHQQQIKQLQSQHDKLCSQLDQNIKNLQWQNEKNYQQITSITESNRTLATQLDQLNQTHQQLQTTLDKKNIDLEKKQIQISELTLTLQEHHFSLTHIKQEKESIAEKHAQQQQCLELFQSHQKQLQYLTSELKQYFLKLDISTNTPSNNAKEHHKSIGGIINELTTIMDEFSVRMPYDKR
ncbi:DNA-binding protein [Marinibactrum halimedae]|uniref:Uncharacterized protein n=1 Tax=Marinibactrum halimedae TaxID=1444977 RepID=A0AA37TDM8_9GAMM|nr:DNA-binding protein [Marinibactrum halimedae]MCD9460562.1 DNA-binding protein [Marinibactrum halimedae]GLS27192.1 hypothetical protein GCM10007877_29110 [Marinibactrum halimedae]